LLSETLHKVTFAFGTFTIGDICYRKHSQTETFAIGKNYICAVAIGAIAIGTIPIGIAIGLTITAAQL
jgi:hypothetical protein